MTSWRGKDGILSLVTIEGKYQCHTFCTSPWAGKAQWWHMGHAWMPFYHDTLSPSCLRFQQNSALHEQRLLHPCSFWEQELLLEAFGFTTSKIKLKVLFKLGVPDFVFTLCECSCWLKEWMEKREKDLRVDMLLLRYHRKQKGCTWTLRKGKLQQLSQGLL